MALLHHYLSYSILYSFPHTFFCDHHGFILPFHSNVVSQRPSLAHAVLCSTKLTLIEHGTTDWNSLCFKKYQDVNQPWSVWQSGFCSVMEDCIPKKVLPAPMHLPWVSPDLLQAIQGRNALFRAYKRTESFSKLVEYRRLQNILVSSFR